MDLLRLKYRLGICFSELERFVLTRVKGADMSELYERINESASYIKGRCKAKPSVGIVLGSGLGGRGLAMLTGDRTDVEAAAELATRALAGRNVTLCHSIISNVHGQIAERLSESSRFFGRK